MKKIIILPILLTHSFYLQAEPIKQSVEMLGIVHTQVACTLSRCEDQKSCLTTISASGNHPIKNSEVKVSIPCSDKLKLTKYLELDETRNINFFDTPSLDLKSKDIVLRERNGENTVKIVGVDPNSIDDKWFSQKDFKCEEDAVVSIQNGKATKVATPSCSFSVEAGGNFSDEQKAFLKEVKGVDLAQTQTLTYGSIPAVKYKYKDPALSAKMPLVEKKGQMKPAGVDIEEWNLPAVLNADGSVAIPAQCYLEVSAKVPVDVSESTIQTLYQYFQVDLKLDVNNTVQGKKSSRVLNYFLQAVQLKQK